MWPFLHIPGLAGADIPAQAEFKTTASGAVSFSLTKTGAAVSWDMGDGTVFTNTNSVAHNYADSSEKTVKIFADDPTQITQFGSLENKDITEIDFSQLNGLGGVFNARDNNNLTVLNMPTASTNPFTEINLEFNDITGLLDLSGCIIQGICRYRENSNLTQVSHSTDATQLCTFYFASNCNLTGTLDLAHVECTTTFTVANNPNLTDIQWKTSTQPIQVNIINNDLTGTLDVSNINIRGNFFVYDNNNLTGITHSANTLAVTSYRAYNCDLIGTLDVSMLLMGAGASFLVYNNSSLNYITHDSSHDFNAYFAYNNDLLGDGGGNLDLSNITLDGTGAGFRGIIISGNSFTSVTHKATAGAINQYICQSGSCTSFDFGKFTNWDSPIIITVYNNGLSAAQMNQVCVDLDAALGAGSGSINLKTGVDTNSVPDSSSGGNDGTAAVSNLVGKGYTVNIVP